MKAKISRKSSGESSVSTKAGRHGKFAAVSTVSASGKAWSGGASGSGDPSARASLSLTYLSVEAGVPASLTREFEAEGLTRDDIRMVIADRTLERRLARNEPLKIEEADAFARLLRIVGHARRVFEDPIPANRWLRTPNPVLGDKVPIWMARTDLGGREVETILGRMEHGLFS